MRGRKSRYPKVGTVLAVAGTGAILYYAIAAFFFCDAYPNRPDSPLPAPPNGHSGLSTGRLTPGPAVEEIAVGAGEHPTFAPTAIDDLETFNLMRLRRIEDAWRRFSGGEGPLMDMDWGSLGDQYAVETPSEEDDDSELGAPSGSEYAQASADGSSERLPAFFSITPGARSETLFGLAAEAGEPRSGMLMDVPFERRMSMFPYRPITDDVDVGAMADTFAGLGPAGVQPGSTIWNSPDLSGTRYRMYGDDTGAYSSPFLDTFDAVPAGPTFDTGSNYLGAGGAGELPDDSWMDYPLIEEPR